MPTVERFEDLVVWQEAREIVKVVYGLTKKFPLVSLALGAVLFLVSDVFLGHRLFQGGTFLLVGDLVWMTYIVGQLLIVFSTATGLRLL